MKWWHVYFIVKLDLFYQGLMGFHWLPNFALALTCAWPLKERRLRMARDGVAIVAGAALFYHDTWFPPIGRVESQMGALEGFDWQYLLDLSLRLINLHVVAVVAALLVVYAVLSRRLRFATFVILGILSVPLFQWVNQPTAVLAGRVTQPVFAASAVTGAPLAPADQLQAFYAEQAQQRVNLPPIADPKTAFDIVYLQVCSLSWDDLDFEGEAMPALFDRFDVVFRHFNSAASYSGPAALRLLRSGCGQLPHKALYAPDPPQCNLFADFAQSGYAIRGLLNHDGVFGGFAGEVAGELGRPVDSNQFAAVDMHAFDGSPIRDDYDTLSGWWQTEKPAGPVALFYNTISLHDGNRIPGVDSFSSLKTYKPRLDKLLADFGRFIYFLEQRKRPVVLVLIPEHGAALRGDKVQIPGMREIPSPQITEVPVAIKLIGFHPQQPEKRPLIVNQPTSYFAITTLIDSFMRDDPFTGSGGKPLSQRVATLPETPLVSENSGTLIMSRGDGYVLRSSDGTWIPYR